MNSQSNSHISFCLCPGYPLFCIASALDVLRHANRLSETEYYSWTLLTESDQPIASSSGVSLVPDQTLKAVSPAQRTFIIAGLAPSTVQVPNLAQYLHRQVAAGAALGGISNGAFVLGQEQLLNGYAATVHWEDFATFCVLHGEVAARYQRYVVDRDRMSCSGGTSTLDLFLEIVRKDLGSELALMVSRQLLMEPVDQASTGSSVTTANQGRQYSYRVQRALGIIGSGVTDRLNVNSLAEQVGLSRRQLLRLFRRETGKTPYQILKQQRLERSHALIVQSHLPLATVATAVGFSSQSHLTSAYKRHYGRTPAEQRRRFQIGGSGSAEAG